MKRYWSVLLLVLVYAAFISLGLPDSALGVAWPSMRSDWGQPLEAIGIFSVIVTICSAISGFASARVLKRLGAGPVVLISCVLTGGAMLGFSLAPSFLWLIPLAFPFGLGAGSVDAGLNHFVAEHYSSRHMNWLHCCWGVGATIAPIIMGRAIAGPGWTAGYRTIAFLQLGLALVFLISLPLWNKESAVPEKSEEELARRPRPGSTPRWAAWLGPVLYFVYTAIEFGTGLWAASILVDGRGVDKAMAGIFLSCFYGSIMVGRFLTGFIASKVHNRTLARAGLIVAFCGAVLFALSGRNLPLCVGALALLGLGCAPVYPSLMHETPRRYDPETARAVVGRQVAFAYLGGAIVPPLFGLMAAHIGLWVIMPGVALSAALMLLLSEILNKAT
jgi:fucose permease